MLPRLVPEHLGFMARAHGGQQNRSRCRKAEDIDARLVAGHGNRLAVDQDPGACWHQIGGDLQCQLVEEGGMRVLLDQLQLQLERLRFSSLGCQLLRTEELSPG